MWWGESLGYNFGLHGWFVVLVVWSLVWKGLGLWRAARKGSKYWFVAILVLNTVGVLPIVYLLVWGKEKAKGKGKKK